jgi:lysophospholipase L1-like esterase
MDIQSADNSHSLANYTAQLEAIADRLVATKSKLLYVATTPFMPADNTGNPVIHELNKRALAVAKARGIPYVDVYSRVTDKCGALYTNCSICALSPCTFHYNDAGYEWIAEPLAAAILKANSQLAV